MYKRVDQFSFKTCNNTQSVVPRLTAQVWHSLHATSNTRCN